jgi:DNA repair exonuclease SbcCD ATPase subunit
MYTNFIPFRMPPSRFAQLKNETKLPSKSKAKTNVPVVVNAEEEEKTTTYLSVQLTNFRCWDNVHTFTIPLHRGLVLLQAPSGSGKSSIISAINWVISGKTAVNSCSWNKKRMSAELSWFPCHPHLPNLRSMFRCNTPRQFKLTFVDGHIIDVQAEADSWLAQHVGIPFSMIGQLSVLGQKLMGVHSHLMQLPQADKSVFLQQLFVPDERHKEIVESLRSFCKSRGKDAEKDLGISNALITQTQRTLDDVRKELNSTPTPVALRSRTEIERRISDLNNHRILWNSRQALVQEYQSAIAHMRHVFESSHHTDLLVPFSEWVSDWYADDIHDQVSQLIDDCATIALEQTHTANAVRLETLLQNEQSSRQERLQRAQMELNRLNQNESRLQFLDQDIERLTTDMNALSQRMNHHTSCTHQRQSHIKRYGSDADLQNKLEQLQKDAMSLDCPNCGEHIQYSLDQGWIVDADKKSVSSLSMDEQAQRIKDKQRWDEVMAERKRLNNDYTSMSLNDTEMKQLNEDLASVPQSIRIKRTMLNKWNELQSELRSAQQGMNAPSSSEIMKLRQKPIEHALPLHERQSAERHDEAGRVYSELSTLLGRLKIPSLTRDSSLITPFGSVHEEEIVQLKIELSQCGMYERISKWEVDLEQAKDKAQQNVQMIESVRTLERLSRDIELEVLQQHLVPLNAILQQLLDDVMFQDGGEMQCQFQVSNMGVKPEVHMMLFQRGQACDERSLSGGEYDRLVLAVSLSLYRLFASKIGLLCLDESLSSLDTEVSNTILTRLHDLNVERSWLPGLTIMVDHHNGTGMFDYTLKL